jgi:hypothetical protein
MERSGGQAASCIASFTATWSIVDHPKLSCNDVNKSVLFIVTMFQLLSPGRFCLWAQSIETTFELYLLQGLSG